MNLSARAPLSQNESDEAAPRRPVCEIGPASSAPFISVKELWHQRDIIYMLSLRDIKVRYKHSVLGVGWAIIQPVSTMITFWFILGKVARIPSDGIPYALFTYSGIVLWTFFSNSVSTSGQSILNGAPLITKIYFPRLAIPISSIGCGILDISVSLFILASLRIYYHVPLTWELLLAPPLVVMTAVTALEIGIIISSLTVRYRDIRYVLPFCLQMGMYGSPVIYPLSSLPPKIRYIFMLNPMTGLIDAFRNCVVGRTVNFVNLGISLLITVILFWPAVSLFKRMERDFADII